MNWMLFVGRQIGWRIMIRGGPSGLPGSGIVTSFVTS